MRAFLIIWLVPAVFSLMGLMGCALRIIQEIKEEYPNKKFKKPPLGATISSWTTTLALVLIPIFNLLTTYVVVFRADDLYAKAREVAINRLTNSAP